VKLAQLTTRKAEVAVDLIIVAIAAIVIRETVRLGPGWGPSGPQPGFFPFVCAVVMATFTLAALVQTLRSPGTSALFDTPDEARELLKVGVPMLAAVASIQVLGFYLMTALYMGLFSAWYGRYRWYVVLAASVLVPVVLFFTFERGFRIALPKSAWYGDLIPF
jgi:putative tricarboxylic transport membrane protein